MYLIFFLSYKLSMEVCCSANIFLNMMRCAVCAIFQFSWCC